MLKKIKKILTKKYNCPVGILAYPFTAGIFAMGVMFGQEIAGNVVVFFPGQYLLLAMIMGYFSHTGMYYRGKKEVYQKMAEEIDRTEATYRKANALLEGLIADVEKMEVVMDVLSAAKENADAALAEVLQFPEKDGG